MKTLEHLTLTTGHTRASPRSEVADHVIAMLRPLLRKGYGEAAGLTIVVEQRGPGSAVYSLSWIPGTPCVRCWLCWSDGGELWAEATGQAFAAPSVRASVEPARPWLAAALLPGAAVADKDEMLSVGDAERCVAWALLAELQ